MINIKLKFIIFGICTKNKENKLKCFIPFIYCLLSLNLVAQQKKYNVDSLETVKIDTTKVSSLLNLGEHYQSFSLETSEGYIQEPIALAEKTKSSKHIAASRTSLRALFFAKEEYDEAHEPFLKAFETYKKINGSKEIAIIHHKLGFINWKTGNFKNV